MKYDVGGDKSGKGRSDVNSSTFMMDLGMFAWSRVGTLQQVMRTLQTVRRASNGDTRSLINVLVSEANALFMMCDTQGMNMRCADQQLAWMRASWLLLLAAEIQVDFPIDGWSKDARQEQIDNLQLNIEQTSRLKHVLCLEKVEVCPVAMHLLPRVALVRLGIHQELCVSFSGFEKASSWKCAGLHSVQARMASAKRHFDAIYAGKTDEDHIIHLVWNMMAIYHTCVHFPHKNDVITIQSRTTLSAVSLAKWLLTHL